MPGCLEKGENTTPSFQMERFRGAADHTNPTVSGSLPHPDHLLSAHLVHLSSILPTRLPFLHLPWDQWKCGLEINAEPLLLKIYIIKFSVPHILTAKSSGVGLLAQ